MKKRISKLFCVVLSVMLMVSTVLFVPVGAATATPISTKEELNNIRNDRAGNYYLTCDIVFTPEDFMQGGAFYNGGKGFIPLSTNSRPFSGTFDGNGYSIKGLQISVSGLVYTISTTPITGSSSSGSTDDEGWTGDYPIPPSGELVIPDTSPVVGLFGNNTGTITNLYLEDATISGNATNGAQMYIGGITGHNNGTVSNCAVKAIFSGSSAAYVGGVVGYQSAGSVENCVSFVNITSGGRTAGIAGAVASGSVTKSYSVATSKSAVAISNSTSTISAYYVADADVEGLGTRIATEKANNAELYEGFDFDTVWYMDAGLGMPWLSKMPFVEEPVIPDAPSAPIASEVTATTVTLVATEGYEYSLDGEVWQTSNIFENLIPDTEYVFYQRVAETNTHYASEASEGLVVKTASPYTPGDVNDSGVVDLDDVVALAQIVAGWQNVVHNAAALDVNLDGAVTLDDVVLLAQYVAGWNVELN